MISLVLEGRGDFDTRCLEIFKSSSTKEGDTKVIRKNLKGWGKKWVGKLQERGREEDRRKGIERDEKKNRSMRRGTVGRKEGPFSKISSVRGVKCRRAEISKKLMTMGFGNREKKKQHVTSSVY